jgi:hypothetical protein
LRFIYRATVALAFSALSVGLMALSAAPARAQFDSKTILVQDLKAYLDRCQPANRPPVTSQDCTNERDELAVRQKKLNMSDAELKEAVRGGFRGHLGDRKD